MLHVQRFYFLNGRSQFRRSSRLQFRFTDDLREGAVPFSGSKHFGRNFVPTQIVLFHVFLELISLLVKSDSAIFAGVVARAGEVVRFDGPIVFERVPTQRAELAFDAAYGDVAIKQPTFVFGKFRQWHAVDRCLSVDQNNFTFEIKVSSLDNYITAQFSFVEPYINMVVTF